MLKQGTTVKKDDFTGFSERFNELLDIAGFPGKGSGRLTEVAPFLGLSVSGARKWIVQDKPPPKKGDLITAVAKLLGRNKKTQNISPERVAVWLEWGSDNVQNPFKDSAIVGNHQAMAKIYLTVDKQATESGIDLYKIPEEIMDDVYKCIMEDVACNYLADPDQDFVKGKLLVANHAAKKNKKAGK